MTEKYSHIHKIWQADIDAHRASMIARGEDPDAKPPGKFIKPYALRENNKYRLPVYAMLDDNFRCWWWNSIDRYWKYEFLIMIGDMAIDENDYIIDKTTGFDTDSQTWTYHRDDALRLIEKGITHFIPYVPNRPPLIFCDPNDFDRLALAGGR